MIHGATLAPHVFRLPFSPEINQELPVDLINNTRLGETSAEPNLPLTLARFFIVGVVAGASLFGLSSTRLCFRVLCVFLRLSSTPPLRIDRSCASFLSSTLSLMVSIFFTWTPSSGPHFALRTNFMFWFPAAQVVPRPVN